MIAINILESEDLIEPTDWCRPLRLISMSGGASDSYAFDNKYSGMPQNNVKWVQVRDVFGACWFGRKVVELLTTIDSAPYEFVRGEIPQVHRLKLS